MINLSLKVFPLNRRIFLSNILVCLRYLLDVILGLLLHHAFQDLFPFFLFLFLPIIQFGKQILHLLVDDFVSTVVWNYDWDRVMRMLDLWQLLLLELLGRLFGLALFGLFVLFLFNQLLLLQVLFLWLWYFLFLFGEILFAFKFLLRHYFLVLVDIFAGPRMELSFVWPLRFWSAVSGYRPVLRLLHLLLRLLLHRFLHLLLRLLLHRFLMQGELFLCGLLFGCVLMFWLLILLEHFLLIMFFH
jgi:hypothetical protein